MQTVSYLRRSCSGSSIEPCRFGGLRTGLGFGDDVINGGDSTMGLSERIGGAGAACETTAPREWRECLEGSLAAAEALRPLTPSSAPDSISTRKPPTGPAAFSLFDVCVVAGMVEAILAERRR